MKPDDSSVSREHQPRIREHAKKALEAANGLGRFPTPVADVMEAAKLIVAEGDELSDAFLAKLRRGALKFGKTLKRALSKVLGVLDVGARIVYIDVGIHLIKRVFVKLHEAGHSLIPWQRDLYCAIEDCEKTLAPEVSEAFDREANMFAAEVLFQLDSFRDEAADYAFGISVPLKLSKKYGASVYSSVRRYVSSNRRACVVLILDPPELIEGDGFACSLRRVVRSDTFSFIFGELDWQERYTPDDEIGTIIPVGDRKMSRAKVLVLTDQNGIDHECVAEAFKHKYQVFILIHEVRVMTSAIILIPDH